MRDTDKVTFPARKYFAISLIDVRLNVGHFFHKSVGNFAQETLFDFVTY